MSEGANNAMKHVDEMTCLLYVEGQLERARAQEVSAHTQSCAECRKLLGALERESRLLTRAMLEEDEALPARLVAFQERARRSLQWIWGVVFGLATVSMYGLYTGYIEPWEQQFEQAGFGGSNLVSLLIFQGAFWKGWQSMFSLFEVLAVVMVAGFGVMLLRNRMRRGTALAMVFIGLGALLATPGTAGATEFRKGESVEVARDEIIRGDIYISGASVRIDGTVEGDVYVFCQSAEVNGHVTGDVVGFAQSLRVKGQVDGNVRSFVNTLTITGSVGKSVMTFNETTNLDSGGKIGATLTAFANTLSLDGHVGRDLLLFSDHATISGTIEGGVRAKGRSLGITGGAVIDGPVRFEGHNPPDVSAQAKLAYPVEYKKMAHEAHMSGNRHYFLKALWTAAILLFGVVLFSLMPKFAEECVQSAERYGAASGLGVLVFFGVLIAACIACITFVGIPLGLASLSLWMVALFCAQMVVGTLVGQWILGKSSNLGPLLGRMALGTLIVRVVLVALGRVPVIGGWVHFAVWVWGMGAISLALYRRLQPVIAPNIPSAPVGTPLGPNTTVGGIQTA